MLAMEELRKIPAAVYAFVGITVSWLYLWFRQTPCIDGGNRYANMCYTDITPLFYFRGIRDGLAPYFGADFEYPVLTGYFVQFSAWITQGLGFPMSVEVDESQIGNTAGTFFVVNSVLLLICALATVWAHLRLYPKRNALLLVLSPAIFTEALINWDMLVVMLTSLALLAWAKKWPTLCGVFIGLGTAAKLYPILLLVPLFVLCLRGHRYRACGKAIFGAGAIWLLVNAPAILWAQERWWGFFSFNAERGTDLGSLWYALTTFDISVTDLSMLEAVIMVVGTAAICGLLLLSPKPARLVQGFFLIMVLFLVVNKVYSPQYSLWLLPLLVLCRINWFDWVLFSLAELWYYMSVWSFLDATTADGAAPGAAEGPYALAIFVRIAVQLYLAVRVIINIAKPDTDELRLPGGFDANGGLLKAAPDDEWVVKLRTRLGFTNLGEAPAPVAVAAAAPEVAVPEAESSP